MNKKVLTLCAGLLLAGSSVAFAAANTEYLVGTATPGAVSGYTFVSMTDGFNQFTADQSSWASNDNFPHVSPFPILEKYGAKPIAELENANTEQSEGKYFQFVVGSSAAIDGKKDKLGDGTEVLTMVWVADAAENGAGHYELEIENVSNANAGVDGVNKGIILDRTLWKVTAYKDGTTTLKYTLQNKASQAIIQLDINDVKADVNADVQEVNLKIANGETKWRWAAGETASLGSSVGQTRANNGSKVLQGQMAIRFIWLRK